MNKIPNNIMDAENSDTPRSDAERIYSYPTLVPLEFARQLEREINELRQQVAHLKSNVSPVDYKRAFEYLEREMALMIDKAPEYVGVLRRENERLRRQISTCPVLSGEIGAHHWMHQNGDPEKALLENAELRRQNERLVASLKEAKEIISHFGWTSSDSTEVILKAERWLAAHPEEKK